MNSGRKRLVLGILLLPALLLALVLLFLVAERMRGKISLANYKKSLAAQGEKITAAEFAMHTDPKQNGAALIAEAAEKIKDTHASDHQPPCMRLTESGKAVAGFRAKEWTEDKKTYGWKEVREELDAETAALAEARAALEKPVFDNQLDYGVGANLLLPHLPHGKRLTQRFGVATQLALHNGSTSQATDQLVAQTRLLRTLENDRLLISELVRIAIGAIGRSYTWEALQADGWKDSDLARLSAAWKEPQFLEAMARAMEGERVYVDETYKIMRKSNEETVTVLYWMEESGFNLGLGDEKETPWWNRLGPVAPVFRFLRNEVYCRVWRFAWLDQNECRYMKQIQKIIELLRDAARHKSMEKLAPQITAAYEESLPHNFYDKLRMPGESLSEVEARSVIKPMRMETERSLVLAAIALKRYQVRNGTYPDSLQALTPEYLQTVPIDYMDGLPVRYKLKPDGSFLLYSVGEDGKDDGGDASPAPDKKATKNLWNRRDVVWPAEATLEEVEK